MAKIKYLQRKDDTQRLICRTLHEHNSMVMHKLKEDGSKKRMFNHIYIYIIKEVYEEKGAKRHEYQDFKWQCGITGNDEQEVVKEVERLWGNLLCTNGKLTLEQKKEMI